MNSLWHCPESISGHSIEDVHGKCMYCGRKIGAPQPKPDYKSFPVSEATEFYDLYYNPDYGGHNLGY